MKLLFINSVYGKGSTGKIVKELGEAVTLQGGEYKVAYGRGEKLNDEHCYYIGNKINVYIHAFFSRLTDKTGFYSKRATKKLIKFIREYNPDVIHLHNLHGYYLNVEILFKYLKNEFKGKVLWTLHDCWAFTGHCVHYTYAKCDKWKTGCKKCIEKKEYPKSCFIDNSNKNYIRKKKAFTNVPNLTIITVSEWLKEQAQQSFLGNYQIKRIYNGIDCEAFKPVTSNFKDRYDIKEKKMILLVSDGWNERKGWNRFLEVAKIAPPDWQFVIVGVNKKQLEKLPKNSIGFERIWNRDELIEIYSSADVFYNPSVEETFGLVTAEAMACGTPAVVMNSTACPEIVRLSNFGRVAECNSTAEQVVGLIKELILLKNRERIPDLSKFRSDFITDYLACYFN